MITLNYVALWFDPWNACCVVFTKFLSWFSDLGRYVAHIIATLC